MNSGTIIRKGKLLNKVIFIAVAAVVLIAGIITAVSSVKFSNKVNSAIEEELMVACVHFSGEMNNVWDGSWGYDKEGGGLQKGGVYVEEEYQRLMDESHKITGLDYTIFWDKTRILTTLVDDSTGKRIIGTDAADVVIENCLKKGGNFFVPDVLIKNVPYAGYYVPLKDNDGTIHGMFFSGRPKADVTAAIRSNAIVMIVIALGCVTVIAVAGMLLAQRVSKFMMKVSDDVRDLAEGNLTLQLDERALARKDEIGSITESIRHLLEKIGGVIINSKTISKTLKDQGEGLSDMAGQANEAASSVSLAIDEIAKGSVAQSTAIQTAVTSTDNIGSNIDEITENVNQLDSFSSVMNESCNRAMKAMEELIASNGVVADSVQDIGNTISSTNVSAQEISQFTDAITGIANQTNLLSLNASIEAARAGEAGRGFAVVADEIRELAEQSRESADKIKNVVDKLLADAEASVKVMGTLNENFSHQGERLDQTRSDMRTMSENADNVSDSAAQISRRINNLKEARKELVGVIDDLSAISEENAASAQETNASMEELSATFSMINQSASELLSHASELESTIGYFKN